MIRFLSAIRRQSPDAGALLRVLKRRSRIAASAAALTVLAPLAAAAAGAVNTGTGPVTIGEAAAVYRTMLDDMTTFSGMGFWSMDEVTRTETALRGYDPNHVTQGWFAHHAMDIANRVDFATTVRREADAMGDAAFLTMLETKPAYLRRLPGMRASVKTVMDSINQTTAVIMATGELVEIRATRLQSAREGGVPMTGERAVATGADLIGKYDRAGLYAPSTAPKTAQPALDRVLVLAAQMVVGAADPATPHTEISLTGEKKMRRCVTFSKLNLQQCGAATRFPDERAFCVGRHGLGELGECWRWMLGN